MSEIGKSLVLLLLFVSISLNLDAQISFVAINSSSGETLSNERGEELLVPASIQKVILAGLALSELGGEYRFETQIAYIGSIDKEGVLKGDLIVRGGGDPTLGSKYDRRKSLNVLRDIVHRMSKEGVTCIEGRLVVDASLWGSNCIAPTWPWYDLGNYYAAGAWGLNFMDNAHDLTFTLSNSRKAGPQLISVSGPDNVTFVNELTTGPKGSGDQAYIYGAPFQTRRYIRGSLPLGKAEFGIKGSQPEPPRFFGEALVAELVESGIQIQDELYVVYEPLQTKEEKNIFSIKSAPLKDILKVMLLKSDNVYAEAIFRTLSNSRTYDEALNHYRGHLIKLGFKNSSFYDGCGLSPFNRVSALELTNFLKRSIQKQPELVSLLPSVEATSWNSFVNNNNIRVKSGYMEGVRSYCGVANDEIAFVAIYNGRDFGKVEMKKKLAEFLLKALNH